MVGQATGTGITNTNDNTIIGVAAYQTGNGSGNIVIGHSAGNALTGTEANNIIIGDAGSAADVSTIRIGLSRTSCYIGGIAGATATGGIGVFIDVTGKLGTITSSARYKMDIASMMTRDVERLLGLNPVTFYYKDDEARAHLQYGLIAEEVAETFPELVSYKALSEEEGAPLVPETVYYQHLAPMLLGVCKDLVARDTARQQELTDLRAEMAAMRVDLAALLATR